MIRYLALPASIVLLFVPPAYTWWDIGHSYLTHSAVQHLPEALRTYVEIRLSTINSYASTEPPGEHYIDIDSYDEFRAGQMPRDLNVLYATHGQELVDSRGIAPWVIANYRTTLTAQMSAAENNSDLQQIAQTAGEMAHYIEDINQPLHTTANFNGQITGNTGIHSRYEGTMVVLNLDELPIAAAPQNCVYVTDTVDWVLDSIEDRTWDYVNDIMDADTLARTFGPTTSLAYYDSLWNSTGDFTQSQFQHASEMIASLWYSAWVDAGRPWLFSGDYNDDDTIDAADYVAWRKKVGTSNPLSNDFTPASVSQADFTEWKAHYGLSRIAGGIASSAQLVPEPATVSLCCIFFAFLTAAARRPKGRLSNFFRINRGGTP